jgi:uncharacterized membrane protein SirB2
MSVFYLLKILHVASVMTSYALFFTRGLWMIAGSDRLQQRWVRVVPHVVDTALLASAISLAVLTGMYPFISGWLTAKVTGLVVYIALGTLALKRGRTRGVRIAAWCGAQAVFLYIVCVAITRQVLPGIA